MTTAATDEMVEAQYAKMNRWQQEVCNSLTFEVTNPEKFALIASGEADERMLYLIPRMRKVARTDFLVREYLRMAMGEEFLQKYPPVAEDEVIAFDPREEQAEAWFRGLLKMPTDVMAQELAT